MKPETRTTIDHLSTIVIALTILTLQYMPQWLENWLVTNF